jgi:hypothetical protein
MFALTCTGGGTTTISDFPAGSYTNYNMFSGSAFNNVSLVKSDGASTAGRSSIICKSFVVANGPFTYRLSATIPIAQCGMDLFIIKVPEGLNAHEPAGESLISSEMSAMIERLARLEGLLSSNVAVSSNSKRKFIEEEAKDGDEDESPVYVNARERLKVRV